MKGLLGNMRYTGALAVIAFVVFAFPWSPNVVVWPALGVFLVSGWFFLTAMKRRHDDLAQFLPDDDASDERIAAAALEILNRGRR